MSDPNHILVEIENPGSGMAGVYVRDGEYGGQPAWHRFGSDAGDHWLLWNTEGWWFLSAVKGIGVVPMWVSETLEGVYAPNAFADEFGEATVSAIEDYIRVYRGQDGAMDYETPAALVAPGQGQVEIDGQDLLPDTIWHYVRRAVRACCGKESGDSPVCIVRVGPAMDPAPNPPTEVTAETRAGGVIRLRWRYEPGGRAAVAAEFAIYADSLDGEPVATVPAGFARQGNYVWDSDPYEHGQMVRLCVRAVSGDGAESVNTAFAAAVADDQGPEAISGLIGGVEDLDA